MDAPSSDLVITLAVVGLVLRELRGLRTELRGFLGHMVQLVGVAMGRPQHGGDVGDAVRGGAQEVRGDGQSDGDVLGPVVLAEEGRRAEDERGVVERLDEAGDDPSRLQHLRRAARVAEEAGAVDVGAGHVKRYRRRG